MAKKFPTHPAHPERICWGCDKYCPVNSMCCGNGTERAQHPVELFGEDWLEMLNEGTNAPGEPDNGRQKKNDKPENPAG